MFSILCTRLSLFEFNYPLRVADFVYVSVSDKQCPKTNFGIPLEVLIRLNYELLVFKQSSVDDTISAFAHDHNSVVRTSHNDRHSFPVGTELDNVQQFVLQFLSIVINYDVILLITIPELKSKVTHAVD